MKRLHCSLAVHLLVIACLRWPACDASECTSITQNVLTSENCPANCLNNPCVLYAPSLRTRLPCRNTGASGSCLVDSSYTSDSGPCEITYQCLDSMVNAQDSWFLSTGYIKQSDTMTQAYVTVIENLRFDPSIVSVYVYFHSQFPLLTFCNQATEWRAHNRYQRCHAKHSIRAFVLLQSAEHRLAIVRQNQCFSILSLSHFSVLECISICALFWINRM